MSERSTRQKRAIHKVIGNAPGPLSARDIQIEASKICPNVSLATVYRVVRSGTESGAFAVVRLEDNVARYEVADRQHHHHFLCNCCARVFDILLPCNMVADFAPEDFQVTRHEITLYGNCPDCALA